MNYRSIIVAGAIAIGLYLFSKTKKISDIAAARIAAARKAAARKAAAQKIGKGNPQLRRDLFKNIFLSNTNVILDIIPYIVLILIIYIIIKK